MKTLIDKLPNFDTVIKSSGFAVFVMFSMMAAMAYTLWNQYNNCLLYTSPSPRDGLLSRMPSSA